MEIKANYAQIKEHWTNISFTIYQAQRILEQSQIKNKEIKKP